MGPKQLAVGAWIMAIIAATGIALAQTRPTSDPSTEVAELLQHRSNQPSLDWARITVSVEEPAVAGVPVVFWVLVPNTSDRDVVILLTGPGPYLDDGRYEVRLSSGHVQIGSYRPWNGQFNHGAMSPVSIPARQSLRTPLAIDPLKEGEYQAELWSYDRFERATNRRLAQFKLRVVRDARQQQRWIERRIQAVRHGDYFAAFIALRYNIEPVIETLLTDIAGGDSAMAANAAELLSCYSHVGKISEQKWSAAVAAGLEKHLNDPTTKPNVAETMTSLAWRRPNDRYLPLLLEYTRSANWGARDNAIHSLQSYHQSQATERLVEILNSPQDQQYHWIAGHALLSRGDQRALPTVARMATEHNPKRSGGRPEFELLVMYPDSPVARDAVAAGLKSDDADIRASAGRALSLHSPFLDPLGRNEPNPELAEMTTMEAARIVLEAEEFVVIDQSTAAAAPRTVLAFRMLHGSSGRYAAMHHLYRAGTLPAKLYALCMMYQASDRRLKEFADALVAAGGEVTLVDGPRRSTVPVAQVVSQILDGQVPQRLLRLYNPPTTGPASAPPSRPASAPHS
ncbi:HEAT repeat domain-containing protein [Fontivita pretiosa]|uniref:HEAT repeat domain-containing protein n=1 Tax=Fontivita pretiosa TaxID=2989684 RepID=UPI003D179F0C